jgi:hypothetical protein
MAQLKGSFKWMHQYATVADPLLSSSYAERFKKPEKRGSFSFVPFSIVWSELTVLLSFKNCNHIFVLKTKIRFVFLSKEPCNVIAFSKARIYYFIVFGCVLVNLFLARKKMCLRGFSLYYPYPSSYIHVVRGRYIYIKRGRQKSVFPPVFSR